ncbi:MAG: adenylosuccinate lyase [Deltaproteobacteria bacterium]|jgi:adenylosuccinate lyase|nr:adenylosuccinate lyase [Deltaproteobacteria bacterium]
MIERYSRPRVAALWTLEKQYASWLQVELAVVRAQADMGLIPAPEAQEILDKASFDPGRILEIEAEVGHDVIAFVTCVEERVGRAARFFHFGLTSSDVLDTALALRLGEAADIILEDLDGLLLALKARAEEFVETPIIGRSHGIHAEPTTLGIKFATFYAEFKRRRESFRSRVSEIRVGKLAGPVGNYSSRSLSPALEAAALASLGLKPTPASSQIVPRDVHAAFFLELSLIATSLERLAVEIRHLSRTEVGEVEEAFGAKQKGSSAMPHKKNPIASENISGLARIIRSLGQAALENVPLWHERDISHSSVERIVAPDATILADYILARATRLVQNLVVKEERLQKNLQMTGGLFNSQEILLALIRKGLSRVEAYALVQKEALSAAAGGPSFRERVLSSKPIREHLSEEEIQLIFLPDRFSLWAPTILARALSE